MKNELNGVELYLNEVTKHLDCSGAKRKEILSKIRQSLQEVPEIESMSLSQILKVADLPEDLAEVYLDKETKQKNTKRNRRLLAAIVVIGMVALVF